MSFGLVFDLKLTWRSGYSPEAESLIDPTTVSVTFHPPSSSSDSTPFRVLTNGEPEPNIDEVRAKQVLSEEDIEIVVDLGRGEEEAKVWTCDFSHDYVTINGSVSGPIVLNIVC